MSWSFDLCDSVTGECLITDTNHNMPSATMCIGGTKEMSVDITYNYSDIICNKFQEVLKNKDISYAYFIDGKSGAEVISLLKNVVSKLKNDVDDDYWNATEGNAKRALNVLLAFSQMRPDGIWKVY